MVLLVIATKSRLKYRFLFIEKVYLLQPFQSLNQIHRQKKKKKLFKHNNLEKCHQISLRIKETLRIEIPLEIIGGRL